MSAKVTTLEDQEAVYMGGSHSHQANEETSTQDITGTTAPATETAGEHGGDSSQPGTLECKPDGGHQPDRLEDVGDSQAQDCEDVQSENQQNEEQSSIDIPVRDIELSEATGHGEDNTQPGTLECKSDEGHQPDKLEDVGDSQAQDFKDEQSEHNEEQPSVAIPVADIELSEATGHGEDSTQPSTPPDKVPQSDQLHVAEDTEDGLVQDGNQNESGNQQSEPLHAEDNQSNDVHVHVDEKPPSVAALVCNIEAMATGHGEDSTQPGKACQYDQLAEDTEDGQVQDGDDGHQEIPHQSGNQPSTPPDKVAQSDQLAEDTEDGQVQDGDDGHQEIPHQSGNQPGTPPDKVAQSDQLAEDTEDGQVQDGNQNELDQTGNQQSERSHAEDNQSHSFGDVHLNEEQPSTTDPVRDSSTEDDADIAQPSIPESKADHPDSVDGLVQDGKDRTPNQSENQQGERLYTTDDTRSRHSIDDVDKQSSSSEWSDSSSTSSSDSDSSSTSNSSTSSESSDSDQQRRQIDQEGLFTPSPIDGMDAFPLPDYMDSPSPPPEDELCVDLSGPPPDVTLCVDLPRVVGEPESNGQISPDLDEENIFYSSSSLPEAPDIHVSTCTSPGHSPEPLPNMEPEKFSPSPSEDSDATVAFEDTVREQSEPSISLCVPSSSAGGKICPLTNVVLPQPSESEDSDATVAFEDTVLALEPSTSLSMSSTSAGGMISRPAYVLPPPTSSEDSDATVSFEDTVFTLEPSTSLSMSSTSAGGRISRPAYVLPPPTSSEDSDATVSFEDTVFTLEQSEQSTSLFVPSSSETTPASKKLKLSSEANEPSSLSAATTEGALKQKKVSWLLTDDNPPERETSKGVRMLAVKDKLRKKFRSKYHVIMYKKWNPETERYHVICKRYVKKRRKRRREKKAINIPCTTAEISDDEMMNEEPLAFDTQDDMETDDCEEESESVKSKKNACEIDEVNRRERKKAARKLAKRQERERVARELASQWQRERVARELANRRERERVARELDEANRRERERITKEFVYSDALKEILQRPWVDRGRERESQSDWITKLATSKKW